jgi:hypothetical protein
MCSMLIQLYIAYTTRGNGDQISVHFICKNSIQSFIIYVIFLKKIMCTILGLDIAMYILLLL